MVYKNDDEQTEYFFVSKNIFTLLNKKNKGIRFNSINLYFIKFFLFSSDIYYILCYIIEKRDEEREKKFFSSYIYMPCVFKINIIINKTHIFTLKIKIKCNLIRDMKLYQKQSRERISQND